MVKVAGIEWNGNGHTVRRQGMLDGQVVAYLNKLKNHTHVNEGVWEVEVHGRVLEHKFRHVSDAQKFAAEQLKEIADSSDA